MKRRFFLNHIKKLRGLIPLLEAGELQTEASDFSDVSVFLFISTFHNSLNAKIILLKSFYLRYFAKKIEIIKFIYWSIKK